MKLLRKNRKMNGALRSALGKLSHYLLRKGQKDEECDARDDDSSNIAGDTNLSSVSVASFNPKITAYKNFAFFTAETSVTFGGE